MNEKQLISKRPVERPIKPYVSTPSLTLQNDQTWTIYDDRPRRQELSTCPANGRKITFMCEIPKTRKNKVIASTACVPLFVPPVAATLKWLHLLASAAETSKLVARTLQTPACNLTSSDGYQRQRTTSSPESDNHQSGGQRLTLVFPVFL